MSDELRLWQEVDPPSPPAPAEASSEPGERPNILAMDWETWGWNIYGAAGPRHMTRAQVLRFDPSSRAAPEEAPMSTDGPLDVIVEAAHLAPRVKGSSRAQVYEQDELRRLRFRPLVFSQRQTRKASIYAETGEWVDGGREWKQHKARDAEAIYRYVRETPGVFEALKRYELPGEERGRHLWAPRDELRAAVKVAINEARYRAADDNWAHIDIFKQAWRRMELDAYSAAPTLSPEARRVLGYNPRKPRGAQLNDLLQPVVSTAWVIARDLDGDVRRGPNGEPLGWGFIRGAIGLSHSYMPNLGRSQLTHYGMRIYMNRRAPNGEARDMPRAWRNARRAEFTRAVRDLIRLFQRDVEGEA